MNHVENCRHHSSFWTLNMFGGAECNQRMGIPLPNVTSQRAVYPAYSQKPSMNSRKGKHRCRTRGFIDCQPSRPSENTGKVKRFKGCTNVCMRFTLSCRTPRETSFGDAISTLWAVVLNHRRRISGSFSTDVGPPVTATATGERYDSASVPVHR